MQVEASPAERKQLPRKTEIPNFSEEKKQSICFHLIEVPREGCSAFVIRIVIRKRNLNVLCSDFDKSPTLLGDLFEFEAFLALYKDGG